MDSIKEIKLKRFRFLKAVYDKAAGNATVFCEVREINESLNYKPQELESILSYLKDEGLIDLPDSAWELVQIEHYGIIEVENAVSHPENETTYFPPVINIINVDKMVNSQIQQNTTHSQINATFSDSDLKDLKTLIEHLGSKINDLSLDRQNQNDFKANLDTIKLQTTASRPNKVIVTESLKTIRSILEGVAGNLIAPQLIELVSKFL